METGPGRLFKQSFYVNFVDEYARANASCNLTDLLQRRIFDQNAAGIVKVGQYDQTRVWCDERFDLLDYNAKAIFKRAREAFHFGAEVTNYRKHRLVRRVFE